MIKKYHVFFQDVVFSLTPVEVGELFTVLWINEQVF